MWNQLSVAVSNRGYIVMPASIWKEIKPVKKILLQREKNKIILQPINSFTHKLAGLTAQSFGKSPDEIKAYIHILIRSGKSNEKY